MKKEVISLLTAINAMPNMERYPLGNQVLTGKLKDYESKNLIRYNIYTGRWEKTPNLK
jgi:hypothetical protein